MQPSVGRHRTHDICGHETLVGEPGDKSSHILQSVLCNSSSELQVQPTDHCSGPTSAQEDALKLITDVRFGHRAVVALQAIHPSLPETKPKPKRSSSFPSASLWSGLPQASSCSSFCCSSLILGFPGLRGSFPAPG